MKPAGVGKIVRVTATVFTGAVALSGYAGMWHGADIVFGAGLALVAWIAVQLVLIEAYSWFHPTYLVAAIVVLGLGWLMTRTGSPVAQPARLELQGTRLHG
jgi:hypothetical protein